MISEKYPDAYYNTVEMHKNEIDNCLSIYHQNGSLLANSKVSDNTKQVITMLGNEDALINELIPTDENMDLIAMDVTDCYVSETFKNNGDELICVDSHLMSISEINNIDPQIINNSGSLSTNSLAGDDYDEDTQTKYSVLTLVTKVWDMNSSSGKRYVISGQASWDFCGFLERSDSPAYGDDLIYLSWGGNFDYSNEGCIVTDQLGGTASAGVCKSDEIANAAVGWAFKDYVPGTYSLYSKSIVCAADLTKNTLTGNGNTTSVKCTYIHTYEKTKGTISFSISSNNKGDTLGVGITLNNVEDQWQCVASVSGLYY